MRKLRDWIKFNLWLESYRLKFCNTIVNRWRYSQNCLNRIRKPGEINKIYDIIFQVEEAQSLCVHFKQLKMICKRNRISLKEEERIILPRPKKAGVRICNKCRESTVLPPLGKEIANVNFRRIKKIHKQNNRRVPNWCEAKSIYGVLPYRSRVKTTQAIYYDSNLRWSHEIIPPCKLYHCNISQSQVKNAPSASGSSLNQVNNHS